MLFGISKDTLYQQSDVILAWIVTLLAGGWLLYYITKKEKWPLIMDYIQSTNHRKVGIMYMLSGLLFFFRGGMDALLIRTQLAFPQFEFWVIQGDKYSGVFTTHGTVMIFFVAMPLLIGLMNIAVPLQIGAKDLAYPFLNSLSFWLFFSGAVLFNLSFFFATPPSAGWTAYAPLSLDEFTKDPGNSFYIFSIQISGLGTLLTAVNMISTIIRHRAQGMKYTRMPLFPWATLITSFLILIAFTALSSGLYLLMFDRLFGTTFFMGEGGNPIYWQHLFWIFGHPEVYILALPAFGIFSDVISTFSKKVVFGYTVMVISIGLIGLLGFMVWVHHMFTVGLGPMVNTFFAITTMLIAVPTGIKVFNWLFTMRGGRIQVTTPMLFALGFIPTFVMGGVTGVMLAIPAADFQFHDSHFVVAHFHYTIIGATVLGIFAGMYYWYPKMFGKSLDEKLGKWHFWLFVVGFHLTFLPMHFSGLQGMPRRTYTYIAEDQVFTFNAMSTVGAFLMGVGMLFFAWNIYRTHKSSKEVSADPWDGRTLEWAVSSPPSEEAFERPPEVFASDPLWKSKMGEKELKFIKSTRPGPVATNSFIPILFAGALFLFSMGMIYQWYWLAAVFAIAGFGLLFLRSFLDERIEHYKQKRYKPEDLKKLLHDKRTGFFSYLVIDSIMFLILFTTYVMFTPAPTGPKPEEVFEARTLIISSLFLLPSSLTMLLAEYGLKKGKKGALRAGVWLTLLLGIGFLVAEGHEFYTYIHEGYLIDSNVFMASFYVLVGLHYSHVLFGVGWLSNLLIQQGFRSLPEGLYEEKQTIFSYYWHFVDLIWIFIIGIVYLPYLIS
ncbi:cytochrome c oxidase subunit 1 [Halobacillus dabanensis]|uniref:Cytochrome c oxidase subunit 1 n=1 Tax=Halobacillus dabanensis TaxID=240302 RepID=A0A1I3U0W1_HALDA|nr:cbb3-type cytochrome c oxidase subunit I [Halobacillus dabanensis]SFJ76600.1 cytochrome c oxidase subunit 1 [Halobacillus dabanensis]